MTDKRRHESIEEMEHANELFTSITFL